VYTCRVVNEDVKSVSWFLRERSQARCRDVARGVRSEVRCAGIFRREIFRLTANEVSCILNKSSEEQSSKTTWSSFWYSSSYEPQRGVVGREGTAFFENWFASEWAPWRTSADAGGNAGKCERVRGLKWNPNKVCRKTLEVLEVSNP